MNKREIEWAIGQDGKEHFGNSNAKITSENVIPHEELERQKNKHVIDNIIENYHTIDIAQVYEETRWQDAMKLICAANTLNYRLCIYHIKRMFDLISDSLDEVILQDKYKQIFEAYPDFGFDRNFERTLDLLKQTMLLYPGDNGIENAVMDKFSKLRL